MRVLFINNLYAPDLVGGAERVMQAQAEALQQGGHEVAVLALSAKAGLHCDHVNGIPVWRAGLRNVHFPFGRAAKKHNGTLSHNTWHLLDVYNPLMVAYVRKVVKEFQPQVVSVHNLAGWSVAAWDVLMASKVPIVQVLHDQYLLCATSMMYRNGQRCERQCAPCRVTRGLHRSKSAHVDTLVGCSQFICDKLMDYGYFKGVRCVKAIHNIRDVSDEQIPVEPRRDDGTTVLGYIGRLSPAKGIEFLLDTLSKDTTPGWKLIIAGTGEQAYSGYLKDKYRDVRFEFIGLVTAGQFFRQIDATVVPSLWEDTLPSVVFESLLYGRPILGSRIGGIPEMVNSRNGYLFTPGDAGQLLGGVQWALRERDRFRAEIQLIQKEAAPYKDKEKWIEEWTAVYSSAIEHSQAVR